MKANLAAEADQKAIFQEIRNYLAGRMLGATRDEALLEEVMKCLFTYKRMLLENVSIPASPSDTTVAKLYRAHFEPLPGIYQLQDQIMLDSLSLAFVHSKLQLIDVLAPDRDPVGDLYETFVGSAIRGAEGQFFTPQNAGRWLVDAIAPSANETVIDPACGAGGFLVWAAQAGGTNLRLHGIEKDGYLAALARARTAILGAPATIYSGNSLSFESDVDEIRAEDLLGNFDVVLANPPFGKNIRSVSPSIQKGFQLGHKWKATADKSLVPTSTLAANVPPQVLFIERIVSLLKNGGRAGIVVPESLLGSRSYSHVVEYLRSNSAIKAAVGMPENLFKTSGKGGTHTKTCLLVFEKGRKQSHVFMAEAKWCGNDSRGKTIEKDDLPKIIDEYLDQAASDSPRLSYMVDPQALRVNILAPRYHEPAAALATTHLSESHDLVTVGELVETGILEIRTGDEVGKMAYGTGDVPFIRTSDISSWEIKIDPKHCVSAETFERYQRSQDVREGDILMVRDGTYLIGNCAYVTKYDLRIVYQSHIYKIRSLKPEKLSPHLLLAMLSSEPVQQQIKAKTYTQDIINSLGARVHELILPIPKSTAIRQDVTRMVEKAITDRVEARELSRLAKSLIVQPEADEIKGERRLAS